MTWHHNGARDGDAFAVWSEDGKFICSLVYPFAVDDDGEAPEKCSSEERNANGRLIAAAPELLEALKACERALRFAVYGGPAEPEDVAFRENETILDAAVQACAAIAKATDAPQD